MLITILARRLARRVRGGPGVPVAKPVASTAYRDRVRATHPRSAACRVPDRGCRDPAYDTGQIRDLDRFIFLPGGEPLSGLRGHSR
jgi:hypothetical protein